MSGRMSGRTLGRVGSIRAFNASSPEKPPDARLDFRPGPAEAPAAGLDQTVRTRPTAARGGAEIEVERGRGAAVAQQPCPGGAVAKVKKCVRASNADLLGKEGGIFR